MLPKSSAAAFSEIRKILDMGWVDIPTEGAFNGSGAPGRLLEHLLGIDENNRDSPDLFDWEIKFHGGISLITLFHKDPEPKGIMDKVVDEFGWKDKKNRISFRHTLRGASDRDFFIVNENNSIFVKNLKSENLIVPEWKHNTLLNAAGAKLRRLILVEGKIIKKPVKKVIYESATAYWDFDLLGFCKALEDGIVYIDFDARTNGERGTSLRNHGTKFRINLKDIGALYAHSQKI